MFGEGGEAGLWIIPALNDTRTPHYVLVFTENTPDVSRSYENGAYFAIGFIFNYIFESLLKRYLLSSVETVLRVYNYRDNAFDSMRK